MQNTIVLCIYSFMKSQFHFSMDYRYKHSSRSHGMAMDPNNLSMICIDDSTPEEESCLWMS